MHVEITLVVLYVRTKSRGHVTSKRNIQITFREISESFETAEVFIASEVEVHSTNKKIYFYIPDSLKNQQTTLIC